MIKERVSLAEELFIGGYGHHRILCDSKGEPVDYIFLDVNRGFEQLTGLKKEMVIGKRVTQVLPGIMNPDFNWIKTFGQVALGGGSVRFEEHCKPLERWFSISAFSFKKGYFSAIFLDSTFLRRELERAKKLAAFFKEQSSLPKEGLELKVILHQLLKLTQAKYGLLITFQKERGRVFVNSMAGKPNRLKKISEILQYTLEGMEFPLIPEKIESLKRERQIESTNLYDFSYGFIPLSIAKILDTFLHVHNLYSIAIPYRGELIGEFCLAFAPKKKMPYPYLVDLFAHQVGLLLKGEGPFREREKGELKRKYQDVLSSSSNALALLCPKEGFVAVNSAFSNLTGYSEEELLTLRLKDLFQGDKRESLGLALEKMLEEDYSTREYPMVNKNGEVFYLSLHTLKVEGDCSIVFAMDTTLHYSIPKELLAISKGFIYHSTICGRSSSIVSVGPS